MGNCFLTNLIDFSLLFVHDHFAIKFVEFTINRIIS